MSDKCHDVKGNPTGNVVGKLIYFVFKVILYKHQVGLLNTHRHDNFLSSLGLI